RCTTGTIDPAFAPRRAGRYDRTRWTQTGRRGRRDGDSIHMEHHGHHELVDEVERSVAGLTDPRGRECLQRIILPRAGEPLDVRSLYFTEADTNGRRAHSAGRTRLGIGADSEVSFATYFNAFPAAYWRRWTILDEVVLRLTVRGHGRGTALGRMVRDGRRARDAPRRGARRQPRPVRAGPQRPSRDHRHPHVQPPGRRGRGAAGAHLGPGGRRGRRRRAPAGPGRQEGPRRAGLRGGRRRPG